MSRRLLMSMMILAFAAAVIGVGTYALYTDVETSADNTFTAGTLDLKVWEGGWDGHWSDDPIAEKITVTNVKPTSDAWGWSMVPGGVKIKNAGSVPGNLWIEIVNIRNSENDCIEPEVDAGDDASSLEGELGGELKVKPQDNTPPWAAWAIQAPLTAATEGTDLFPTPTAASAVLNANEEVPLVFWYRPFAPEFTQDDNLSMTDTVTFDIIFHLDQAE